MAASHADKSPRSHIHADIPATVPQPYFSRWKGTASTDKENAHLQSILALQAPQAAHSTERELDSAERERHACQQRAGADAGGQQAARRGADGGA